MEHHFGAIREAASNPGNQAPIDIDGADSDREENEKQGAEPNKTEIEGKGRTQVEVLEGEDLKAPDVPQHTFEKVETLEEFEGVDRQLDGVDDLKGHQEALDELEMKHVLRSKDRSASLYRADIVLSPFELEARGKSRTPGTPYPEWDFRKNEYKQDWCWIQVTGLETKEKDWAEAARKRHGGRILALKRKLEQFSTDYLRARAQPAGDEFDLEAVVDARISMRCGSVPSENIYTHRRFRLRHPAGLPLFSHQGLR